MKHVGQIIVNGKVILETLDFSFGIILAVRDGPSLGTVELTIEHPDMPEIEEGYPIPVVTPAYERYEDNTGRFIINRVHPPKGE